jgi:hypothetical protein
VARSGGGKASHRGAFGKVTQSEGDSQARMGTVELGRSKVRPCDGGAKLGTAEVKAMRFQVGQQRGADGKSLGDEGLWDAEERRRELRMQWQCYAPNGQGKAA